MPKVVCRYYGRHQRLVPSGCSRKFFHFTTFVHNPTAVTKYLLHYFGEEFDEVNGEGADMDDNVRNPKVKTEAQNQIVTLLKVITYCKYQTNTLKSLEHC